MPPPVAEHQDNQTSVSGASAKVGWVAIFTFTKHRNQQDPSLSHQQDPSPVSTNQQDPSLSQHLLKLTIGVACWVKEVFVNFWDSRRHICHCQSRWGTNIFLEDLGKAGTPRTTKWSTSSPSHLGNCRKRVTCYSYIAAVCYFPKVGHRFLHWTANRPRPTSSSLDTSLCSFARYWIVIATDTRGQYLPIFEVVGKRE